MKFIDPLSGYLETSDAFIYFFLFLQIRDVLEQIFVLWIKIIA